MKIDKEEENKKGKTTDSTYEQQEENPKYFSQPKKHLRKTPC